MAIEVVAVRAGPALPGLLLAMLLGALDQTIIAPALPAVADELGDLGRMPDVVTAYLVAATVVMPLYGKLGDRFGRKRVMQAAIVLFAAGAALCAVAESMAQLTAFRAVQGAGGGGLMIGAQAIIGEIVSPRERGRYLGLIGAVYAVAVVGGPLAGGFFVDELTWRWIFVLYLPLGVLAFALLTATLRLPPPVARPGLDLAGALTLAVAVVGIVLFGQTQRPLWIAGALAGLTAWLVSTRYARDPILPLRLFRDPAFAIPVAISFLLGFALFGTITYLPAILQIATAATATQAGLLVTALMAGVLITTVVSGRLITRTGRYTAYPIAGTAITTAGLVLLAVTGTANRTALIGVLLLIGLGAGLVMQVMVLAAQNGVGYEHLGTATSSVTFLRQIGASVGVAVMGALVAPRLTGEAAQTATHPFWVMAPLLGVAFVLALALPARPLRQSAHIDSPDHTHRGDAMTVVAPLDAFGRTDLARAGGKGANLGELIRAGFPVPAGFVVTTDAYVKGAGDVPGELRRAIAQAYAALGGGPVAVRSSATAEDLPGAAFAGQQDTYLNIVGEEALIDAVRRCWGSLWTERAIAYRRRLGIDDGEVSIAVVVQRMVDAEVAGVMFTADPVTGDRGHIVVDASGGLGEAVVSGLVTPDHYVLDKRGRVREFTAGRREVVVRARAGGGVVHETGGADQRLPEEALKELARLGRRVEVHFGRPQDIEWAYAHNTIVLLQARPMTALPPPPIKLNRFQRKIGSILLEYLPVRPYPIDTTTWLPHGPAGLMNKIVGYFGIRGPFDGFLPEEDGVVVRMVPSAPRPTLGILRAPFRFAKLARRYDPARWTEEPRFEQFLARVRDLGAQDLRAMPWQRLQQVPRQALALVEPVTDFRTRYLPAAGLAILRLFLALKRLGRAEMLADLIMGAHTRTADANRALEELARRVREDADLREAVDALDVRRLRGDFAARFASFLDEYGHRETASPILVSPPTWGESPETVLGLIKVLAAKAPERVKPADDALARLLEHPRLRDPKRRERMRRMVERARAGVAFREDSHFYFTTPLPILRRSLLEIGRRLGEAGVLTRPEDVFHLRLEEIDSIGYPAGLGESEKDRLRATVRRRAAKREELAGVRLIDPRAIFPPTDRGDALVAGVPAGGGIVTGPVRVIRDPAEFGTLESGDVLVCPYTNPSWTPLFQRAAAVVVDSGGIASHAAIVAREYGIAAVMGTATGTSTLVDGQVVTVDGDTGRVTAHGD